ncbi:MAG: DUF547 domain-containing protein [Burkholderiaceae bacterium]
MRQWLGRMMAGAWLALVVALPATAADFDHDYRGLGDLLARHVRWTDEGVASQVDYAGFKRDAGQLQERLDALSAVTPGQFESFTRDQRLAFLINAYNGFTIALILTEYPNLDSIKDLGSFFRSPWKKSFFSLLGAPRTLDWIEHERIRAPGVFDEPRIHFVVNCASIGCPALRPEPMKAATLEAQLADSTRRFLSDHSRNRFDPSSGSLQVSKIFDWYGGDFAKGHLGINSLTEFFARHAEQLADDPQARARVRAGTVGIEFLDYDWSLNRAP